MFGSGLLCFFVSFLLLPAAGVRRCSLFSFLFSFLFSSNNNPNRRPRKDGASDSIAHGVISWWTQEEVMTWLVSASLTWVFP